MLLVRAQLNNNNNNKDNKNMYQAFLVINWLMTIDYYNVSIISISNNILIFYKFCTSFIQSVGQFIQQ